MSRLRAGPPENLLRDAREIARDAFELIGAVIDDRLHEPGEDVDAGHRFLLRVELRQHRRGRVQLHEMNRHQNVFRKHEADRRRHERSVVVDGRDRHVHVEHVAVAREAARGFDFFELLARRHANAMCGLNAPTSSSVGSSRSIQSPPPSSFRSFSIVTLPCARGVGRISRKASVYDNSRKGNSVRRQVRDPRPASGITWAVPAS